MPPVLALRISVHPSAIPPALSSMPKVEPSPKRALLIQHPTTGSRSFSSGAPSLAKEGKAHKHSAKAARERRMGASFPKRMDGHRIHAAPACILSADPAFLTARIEHFRP